MGINCGVLVVLTLSAVMSGCAANSNAKPATAGQSASVTGPVVWVREDKPHVYRHSNTTITTLLPVEASPRIANKVLDKKVGFMNSSNTGLFASNYAGGDRFTAGAAAISAMKEEMVVLCRFRSETETTVEFKSDLPEEQHAIVWREIIAELAKPAAAAKPEAH